MPPGGSLLTNPPHLEYCCYVHVQLKVSGFPDADPLPPWGYEEEEDFA